MSAHRHVIGLHRLQRSHLAFSLAFALLMAGMISLGGVALAPQSTAAPLIEVSPEAPTITQASCTDGTVGDPTVVLATTTGVVYSVDNADPHPGDTVTVTAHPDTGYTFVQPVPTGWDSGSAGSATYAVELDSPPCDTPVTPEDPAVDQTSCQGGQQTVPSVTPATTAGIDYTVDDATPGPGDTVVVTATPATGHTLRTPLPAGWTAGANGTATYRVVLDDPSCYAAGVPVAPAVVQAGCVDGAPSVPSVTPATTPGIDYTTDAARPAPGDTVRVTATPTAGRSLVSPLPTGWTAGPNGTAVYTVRLDTPECLATPVAPSITQASCTGGTSVRPSVIPAATAGIDYTVSKARPVAGDVVLVTATPLDGRALTTPLPAGWFATDWSGTATYRVLLSHPDCGTVVNPVLPDVQQATCKSGGGHATVTAAATRGITYTMTAKRRPDTITVTVVATPQTGFTLGKTLPKGWVSAGHGSAKTTVVVHRPTCGGIPPGGIPSGAVPSLYPHDPGTLPNTGGVHVMTLVAGLGLLFGGVLMTAYGWRARRQEGAHRRQRAAHRGGLFA